jgi:hypothetical protein
LASQDRSGSARIELPVLLQAELRGHLTRTAICTAVSDTRLEHAIAERARQREGVRRAVTID